MNAFAGEAFTIRENVPLSSFCTMGVGGPARYFAVASSLDDLLSSVAHAHERGLPLAVVGAGSNIICSDAGFSGLVVKVGVKGIAFDPQSGSLSAKAGEEWDDVVRLTVQNHCAGFECLSGIPGTIGAAPIQNVGAYGQEIADTLVSLTAVDRATADVRTMTAADCEFGYRTSWMKSAGRDRLIVYQVDFQLRPHGAPTMTYKDVVAFATDAGWSSPSLQDVRDAVVAIRRRKGMVLDASDPDTRSVGSFFLNPVVSTGHAAEIQRAVAGTAATVAAFPAADGMVKIPAAWLLEAAGIRRGEQLGGAAVSSKQPLAITNRGTATAADVIALAASIKRRVYDAFGVQLTPEPRFIGFDDGSPEVAFLRGPDGMSAH